MFPTNTTQFLTYQLGFEICFAQNLNHKKDSALHITSNLLLVYNVDIIAFINIAHLAIPSTRK